MFQIGDRIKVKFSLDVSSNHLVGTTGTVYRVLTMGSYGDYVQAVPDNPKLTEDYEKGLWFNQIELVSKKKRNLPSWW